MAQAELQSAFTAGEFSPALYGRTDLDKYERGAALLRNFFVDYRGGATNRPGTRFCVDLTSLVVDPLLPPRVIPFVVSTDAGYTLVLSEALISIYLRGVAVTTVVTPYAAADLFQIKYSQSADVMTLTHPSYPPANLSRTSVSVFSYDVIVTGPVIQPPVIVSMRAPHSGPYNYSYLATAVDLDGKEESLPSNIGAKHSEVLNETTNRVVGFNGTQSPQPTLRYNFYKWGPIDAVTMVPSTQWGFVGSSAVMSFSDNNIAPDFTKQPPQWGDPFSGGQIESITVTAGGTGYDGVSGDWPHIPFVPLSISGDGTGAAGYAVIDHANTRIVAAYITNPGKNYTTATITAIGESGTGATFSVTFSDLEPLYPACVSYIQQRRVFGGSNRKPETLVLSQVGLYNNFNATPAGLATDAITVSISSLQINTIKAFVPSSYGLLVFTTGGSFLLNGGTPGAPITPDTLSVQAQASTGANDLPPLVINYDILYGQNKGNRIHNLAFAWQRQSYTGGDVSTLAAHLFDDHQTVDWCYAEEPFKLVWTVREDGKMLTMTYVPDQEVFAWARHDTQGFFRSVCSVPEKGVNAVYVIVERFVPPAEGEGDALSGFVMEAVENWATAQAADFAADTFPYQGHSSTFLFSRGYDPVLRKAFYVSTLAGEETTTNTTGFTLWDGFHSTAPDAVYDLSAYTNFALVNIDIDTKAVTRYEAFDPASTVPVGVGGSDGTWRHIMGSLAQDEQTPCVIDPRTGDAWLHTDIACKIYQLRASENYAQTISPFISSPTDSDHFELFGITDNWVYLGDYGKNGDFYTLELIPRLRTAEETAADYLLSYASFDAPWAQIGPDGNLVSFGNCLSTNGHLFVLVLTVDNTTGLAFNLYKFTPPTSAPFGGPVVGGGWATITPWGVADGPNALAATYTHQVSDSTCTQLMYLHADEAVAVVNVYFEGGDETRYFAQCGYYRPADAAWEFHDTFISGLMTAAWAMTTDYAAAAWAVVGFANFNDTHAMNSNLRPLDVYREYNSFDYGDDDSKRWFYVDVVAVIGGVVQYGYPHGILAQYQFVFGHAPVLIQMIDTANWDVNYPAYATTIGDTSCVEASMPIEGIRNTGAPWAKDTGLSDSATSAFWFCGQNDNFYQFDAATFANRQAGGINAPLLRLTFSDTPVSTVCDGWHWFLERFDDRLTDCLERAWFLDAAVRSPLNAGDGEFKIDAPTGDTILTYCPDAIGHTFTANDIIVIGCVRVRVIDVIDAVSYDVHIIGTLADYVIPGDPDDRLRLFQASDWEWVTPTNVVSGLSHLEGKEVWTLADGKVDGPRTVASGFIVLAAPAAIKTTGLLFQQQIKTLYLTVDGLQPGTVQSKRKQIPAVTLRVDNTLGLKAGLSFDRLTDVPGLIPSTSDVALIPHQTVTGDNYTVVFTDWTETGEVCIQQDYPLPAQVLGVVTQVTPGDTGR